MGAAATVKEILYYFDEPLLVSMAGDGGRQYLGVSTEDVPDGVLWLVAEVSPETMAGIVAGTIELHDAITARRIGPMLKTIVNHPRLKAEAFDGRRKSQVYQTEV